MACIKLILPPRKPHSTLFLLAFALLFMSSMAQGRQLSNAHLRKDEEEMGVKMIGSRPPRCGKCEAVQVPIAANRVEYSRGDDITSYKPMCWKCKCGDFFFNP